ncbi:hypothetical protein KEJ20_03375 [Candidatus Bathyarchaeota archaeon]|nr:hypothetical protein [Candidatus Bathyarchaeota archaeon]
MDAGKTLTFQVKVEIDSDLLEGAIIVNEAIVTWPEGSDADVASTKILVPPPPSPPPTRPPYVGGEFYSINKLF